MGKSFSFVASIGADIDPLNAALKEINTASGKLNSELAAINRALKFDPGNAVLAAQKQEVLAEAIKNTGNKLKELESVQEKVNNAFKNQPKWEEQYAPLKAAIDETKSKLKDLKQQNEKMQADFKSGKISADQYKKYQQELEAPETKMKELSQQKKDLEASFKDGHITGEEYRAYQREVESTRQQLANLKSQQDNAGKSAEELGKTAKETGEDLKGAKNDIKTYEDAVSGLNSAINDVNNDLKGIVTAAAGAAAAVGTAAVGAVSKATEVGAGFEQSMSKVQAISGATGDDLAALEQAAKNMGANTSKTASEAADALSYMALAGWKTEEMLTGLEPILRASEAGEMDLATCSDLVTDSMSAMGVSVNDLSHYLDVVAAAQSNSNTSMQQLLEAFVECGGSAHNFGLNVEDLSAVLGVMANRGIKGAEAGTALNSIFVNMLGSTAKTAEAMDALGLSLYDDTGAMKDVTEVLKEMGSALESATDEQRNSLEAMLGGKTQITALQAMVNGLNGEYDALSETLYNCDGALIDTAKTMQDNLIGNVTAMQSALEGLGIDVYKYLEEPLKSAVKSATEEIGNLSESVKNGQLAETIERLADKFGKLIEKTAGFAVDKGIPALINSLDWISRNGDKIVALIEGMGAAWATWKAATMATHVMSLVKAIKDFKVAQEAATAAQIAANQAAMANVYAMVAAAVVGLVAALVKLAAAHIDARAEALAEKSALDETTQAMLDQQKAIDNRISSYIEECGEIDKKAAKERALWQEIQSLVDEEGNEIDQTGRLGDAINELNTLAGTNIEIIGGQIEGYQGLKTSIDDVIASQQRQAKLSYLQEDVGEALVKIDEAKQQYEETAALQKQLENERDNILKERERLQGIFDSLEQEYNIAYSNGNSDIVNEKYEQMQDILEQLDKFDRKANERLKEIPTELDSALVRENALKDTIDDYNKIIGTYNTILEEEKAAANNSGKDSGQAFGDGFSEGVETGAEGMESTLSAAVGESVAAAKNTAETALKEDTSAAKKRFDALIDELTNEKITREEFNEEYARLTEELAQKQIDIAEYAADKIADYDEKVRKEEMTAWEKSSKEITDNITKTYDDVTKAYEKARSQLISSAKLIDQKVTDTSGADRYILTDFEKKRKELEKYRKDLEKLRETGISDALMEQVMSLSYDTGERQGYIKELLKMSDSQRQAYYRDMDKYYEEASRTAAAEVQDDLTEADRITKEGIESIYGSMPDDAYQKGVETARAYIDGINETMSDASVLRLMSSDFGERSKSDVLQSAVSNIAANVISRADPTGNFYSGDIRIDVTADLKSLVKSTLDEYVRMGRLSDRRI